MNTLARSIIISSMFLFLAACGGGGGGQDATPSKPGIWDDSSSTWDNVVFSD